MIDVLLAVIPLAIVASTPLLLAVEGELVTQRSGMINLGIEGMMLVAAMTSILGSRVSDNAFVGFLAAIGGAALVAFLFGVFAIHFRADQIVTGTAINLLALGLTGFVYRAVPAAMFSQLDAAKGSSAIVVIAWIALPFLLAVVLWRTSFGLRLRACGENPEAVEAAGHSVVAHRWLALAIEAVAAGLAGGYLSLAYSGFAENMTAGRGFIALSIVIFGRWKLKGALLGTAIFGFAAAVQYALQASSQNVPPHLLLAVPYVVTLLILCGVAGRVRAPESLGK
jgi:general nucleoside transport system permease protein